MPPKSIFRQPGAQHFQLVHRSQRDPLIHNPEASQHVLKPFERENAKKGKTREDLESVLQPSDLGDKHVGEAALYGIYYDDTKYDYMQHLRQVGVQEDGVESVLIDAPSTTSRKSAQTKQLQLRDIPAEALASTSELPKNYAYESQQAIPSSIAGFHPDMDPHLRQVLDALEDEAFVDDDLEDDFFGELVKDGERGIDEEVEFEEEDYVTQEHGEQDQSGEDQGWEARFSRFKRDQKTAHSIDERSDGDSEGGDTIGRLPEMSVIGGKGKKRRKGTSDASGYSMSSSSMFRNEALQTLDERFDQIILKEYDEDVTEDDSDEASVISSDTPELITTREDFETMMDDFLDNYEILGRKLKPKLAGDNGAEKLDTLRRAMGTDERVKINGNEEEELGDDILMPLETEDKQDRWDCETILTTYSNLENHPRLIRAREAKPVSKILLDPKTGLPMVADDAQQKTASKPRRNQHPIEPISEEDSDLDDTPHRAIIARSRSESKEEKKARKRAVKAERQARRADKKATKEQFSSELKLQMKGIANKEKTKMRKM